MKFTTQEDIAQPIDQVFAAVTDYAAFEKQAMRRGAEVTRIDDRAEIGVGMSWRLTFSYRGRQRDLIARIDEFEQPHSVLVGAKVGGLDATLDLDLIALSKNRTRLRVEVDLRPQTITARVLVQSLRLGRANLLSKFKKRVADFAKQVEERRV